MTGTAPCVLFLAGEQLRWWKQYQRDDPDREKFTCAALDAGYPLDAGRCPARHLDPATACCA